MRWWRIWRSEGYGGGRCGTKIRPSIRCNARSDTVTFLERIGFLKQNTMILFHPNDLERWGVFRPLSSC